MGRLRVRSLSRERVLRIRVLGGNRLGCWRIRLTRVHRNALRVRGASVHRADNQRGRRVEWRCVRSLRRVGGRGFRGFCKS